MSAVVVIIIVLAPDYKAPNLLRGVRGGNIQRCDNQTQGRLYISELKVNAEILSFLLIDKSSSRDMRGSVADQTLTIQSLPC